MGREWLSEKLENWLNDPDGGHLCAIYGGPGTGKSAFAARFAYRNRYVAASLFFEHGNDYFNSPDAVVRELVFQLACRLPSYRSLLLYALQSRPKGRALNTGEVFEQLLANPLRHAVNGGMETLCVVIDGLDECAPEHRREVARLLAAERFPRWLRVLVACRPENDITGVLRPDRVIDLAADGYYDPAERCYRLRGRREDGRPEGMRKRLEPCAPLLKYDRDAFGSATVGFTHRYIAEWLTGTDEASGQSASRDYYCEPSKAMWALERAWRDGLEAGRPMTEYAALHLLAAMERAGEPEEAIRRVAASEAWGRALVKRRKDYDRKGQWKLCLPFAEANAERCRRAFGPEHPDTLSALGSLAYTYSNLGRNADALKLMERVYEASKRILGEEHPAVQTGLADNRSSIRRQRHEAVSRAGQSCRVVQQAGAIRPRVAPDGARARHPNGNAGRRRPIDAEYRGMGAQYPGKARNGRG